MNVKLILGAALLVASTSTTSPATAETLGVVNVRETASVGDLPRRGLSMAQVEKRYGAPVDKLPDAGGDAPRHPVIHRWRYQGYTVYFERNRVLHSVRGGA